MSGFSNTLLQFLASSIEGAALTRDVVDSLLPNGQPHHMETQYWDYKREFPELALPATEDEKTNHKAALAALVKDAIAFYNGSGGYILFGVEDKGQDRLIGSSAILDVGDFNKRIEGATGHNVECLFARFDHLAKPVGLLMVPRRPVHFDPAPFRRAAPANTDGKRAYAAGDIYVRIRDECRPATATAADWKFLQSDRLLTGSNLVAPIRPIRASLPARDPELVQFVGRESYLSQLRQWLSDKLSPVRLLTGIGGLGKTSIAYHFCEELIDTRAGGVEQLVWLTAKARTFSALKGEMVESGRVDFEDAIGLYKTILEHLGYFPDFEEEPTTAEYVEAIVEAFSTYNCLVVIDDIDSLSADEQREVIFTLSNAASRTVTGDRTPSRILFTSRIDFGLAPANVIKLSGFERDEFATFVFNISESLDVSIPPEISLDDFYAATSGSPLFTTSVLRLVRLGETLSAALGRWKGEEGIDVRRFAFARELVRLPLAASRLLYAVCLLNKTSTVELAQVLEITPAAVSASISNLKSFHLIVTGARGTTGAEITAPDDVVLTQEMLQEHLASSASEVERACAAARKQAETRETAVASQIGQVVALWQRGANSEALIKARKLSDGSPSNGDLTCLLARALTKPGVADWEEAHRKFSLAQKQGSLRPEIVEGLLLCKEQLEDWKGIISLAQQTVSTHAGGEDKVLRAYIRATEELVAINRVRHDRQRRIELARDAIDTIDRRLQGGRLNPSERDFIWKKKVDFSRSLLNDVEAGASRAGDKIDVFNQISWLVERDIYLSEFVTRGLWALDQWWTSVELRPYVDEGAKKLLQKSLARVEQIERVLQRARHPLVTDVQRLRMDLAYRGGKLA